MDKSLTIQIGKRVRNYREHLQLTREQLAELSDLSVQFLAEIENGKKNMTTISLYKLSKALHISTDYIVFGEGNPKQNDFEIILSTLSKRNREYAKELLSVFINAVKGK